MARHVNFPYRIVTYLTWFFNNSDRFRFDDTDSPGPAVLGTDVADFFFVIGVAVDHCVYNTQYLFSDHKLGVMF